ncbi:MAG: hypothetical protein OZ922_01135 [Myxococcales bacterium]|nr:hypothetical protein [Myxococcales bacterium]
MSSHETLKELVADARARVPNPPSWDEVREDAARLRLSAAHAEAAVVAGLVADEVLMAVDNHWSADVNESLTHLRIFDKYSPTTLRGIFRHLSADEIGRLTNRVKGTALELRTVGMMNEGKLPVAPGAARAELFERLNQPGVDVKQLDADGHIVGQVQVKATENWHTIARHLHRYPQYPDVATTHEGAQAMLQHGVDAHHVLDTGVHSQVLTDHVAAHMDNLTWMHTWDDLVPELAIAAIVAVALLRLKNGEEFKDTVAWMKQQMTIAGLANLSGLAVQIVTNSTALRPIAAILTRFTAERGSVAQRTGAALRRVVAALGTLRESGTSRGYAAWSPPETSTAPAT